jgi:hypothetical protein
MASDAERYRLQTRLLGRVRGYIDGDVMDTQNKSVHTMLDTFTAMVVYARAAEHVSDHEREAAEVFVREFAGTLGLTISDERLAELGVELQ